MADTNQRTVASITRKGCGPQVHAYNDPSLSATEFLRAVYCDPTLPMSIRIDAARGLPPYTEPRPASAPSSHIGCTIVIGGLGPCDTDPEQIVGETHSFSSWASNNPHPQSGDQGPSNIETTSYPLTLPDYSTPPTPAELQEIKAAVHALRPDLAHLPIPTPHLCPCGHWIFGPCLCPSRERLGTKLN
jgi:hypothetical protein